MKWKSQHKSYFFLEYIREQYTKRIDEDSQSHSLWNVRCAYLWWRRPPVCRRTAQSSGAATRSASPTPTLPRTPWWTWCHQTDPAPDPPPAKPTHLPPELCSCGAPSRPELRTQSHSLYSPDWIPVLFLPKPRIIRKRNPRKTLHGWLWRWMAGWGRRGLNEEGGESVWGRRGTALGEASKATNVFLVKRERKTEMLTKLYWLSSEMRIYQRFNLINYLIIKKKKKRLV